MVFLGVILLSIQHPKRNLRMSGIICNRILCNTCKDVITSYSHYNFVTCRCGMVSVDGGRSYLRRCGSGYLDLSVSVDAPFEEIRWNLYRGGRGKDGKSKIIYIPLAEVSDEYLDNILAFQKSIGYELSLDGVLQRYEKHYRMINNITVKEE